ncbi:hypothetical protein OGAPHI_002730 [Ogataea philodendri]|uniref:Uncharacterized protein n=1 Tax=Ogataea philodendri TaxID=1378263 RepID=A0A9P8T896_9ASCO|nr:uncharacterized protein OGAPHI_002730 [Ogataea philodendri]KAH3668975.1 hypothetical protein OGAPHI_002730 [Ogataea philodendri]
MNAPNVNVKHSQAVPHWLQSLATSLVLMGVVSVNALYPPPNAACPRIRFWDLSQCASKIITAAIAGIELVDWSLKGPPYLTRLSIAILNNSPAFLALLFCCA